MFIGPKILVLKRVLISSQLDSSRVFLFIIAALLTSRFSPSPPTRALTSWAHSFMLQMSEISGGDCQREVEKQQSYSNLITLSTSHGRGGVDMAAFNPYPGGRWKWYQDAVFPVFAGPMKKKKVWRRDHLVLDGPEGQWSCWVTQRAALQTLWAIWQQQKLGTHLSPRSIWVSAAGDQLFHRDASLHHLPHHLQAQAPVGSCDQHVHRPCFHFLCLFLLFSTRAQKRICVQFSHTQVLKIFCLWLLSFPPNVCSMYVVFKSWTALMPLPWRQIPFYQHQLAQQFFVC